MKLNENRVSWLFTGLIGVGVLSTVAMSIGTTTSDWGMTTLGIIGEVLIIFAGIVLLLVCAKEPGEDVQPKQ
jgi:FtsH-binding integral membrane protein